MTNWVLLRSSMMGLQGWAAQHWYFVRTYPSHIHVAQFGLVWCDKHAECTYLIIPRKQTKLSGRILHSESLRLNSSRVAFIWNPSLQLMVQYRGIWWQLCSDHSFIGGYETKFFWLFSKVKCSRKTAISSWQPFINLKLPIGCQTRIRGHWLLRSCTATSLWAET